MKLVTYYCHSNQCSFSIHCVLAACAGGEEWNGSQCVGTVHWSVSAMWWGLLFGVCVTVLLFLVCSTWRWFGTANGDQQRTKTASLQLFPT